MLDFGTRFILIGIALLGLAGKPEAAPLPSALVEEISGATGGPEAMDYVSPGQVIQLGTSGVVIIAYLDSCTREEIRGGEVTVGARSSQVKNGQLTRDKPSCSTAAVSTSATADVGGVVFRNRPVQKPAEPKRAAIYSTSPMFEVGEPGLLRVQRIDQPGDLLEIDLNASALVKGKFYDFATVNRQLQPGGTYQISLGTTRLVLDVAASAAASGPLQSRWVRLSAK